MNRWLPGIVLLLVFAGGAAAGAAGFGALLKQRLLAIEREGSPAVARAIGSALAFELDLSGGEEAAVQRAVAAAHREFLAFRREHHPRLRAILVAGLDGVEAALEPPARAAFQPLRSRILDHLDRAAARTE